MIRRSGGQNAIAAHILIYSLLGIYTVWSIFPIFWVMLTSLKPPVEALSIPPQLIFKPTLANYYGVIATVYEFPSVIFNSVMIAAIGTLIILVLAIPAAYSLSRLLRLGRNTMSYGIISVRTFPTIGLGIPLYIMMQNANLLDTQASVIVANVAYSLPFGIWMIYGFLESVPLELEEAAELDGCSPFGVLFHIVLPQLLPGVGATAILISIVAWREYLFPLILTSREARTLPIVAGSFITNSGTDWGGLCAYAVMTIVPIAIFCAVTGKLLIQGFVAGAVKG
jgi:multiple sugar transport system permease protein